MSNYPRLAFHLARILIALSFGLAAPALMTQAASAAPDMTFTVNDFTDAPDLNPGDGICDGQPSGGAQCTLRAAVGEANALSGNDTILLPAGEYTVGLSIDVMSNITLQGDGQELSTITSYSPGGQTVFRVRNTGVMTVSAVGFFNCRRAFLNEGALQINDSLFDLCSPASGDPLGGDGGAIYNMNSGNLGIATSAFKNNSTISAGCGGGIYNAGKLDVLETSFNLNKAFNGGAVCLDHLTQMSTIRFSQLLSNQATQNGGGVYADGNVPADARTLWVSNIEGNSAQHGGGIYLALGFMTLRQSSVVSNTATSEGGGLYGTNLSTLNVTNTTISNNSSLTNGGGMYLLGAANLSNATVIQNIADKDGNNNGDGGGIFAGTIAAIHFKNSLLADNHDASTGKFATVSHDCLGTMSADGNVLVGIGNHGTLCSIGGSLNSSRIGSLTTPLDPRLENLKPGPDGHTKIHPLLEDSPAVDGGTIWGTGCTDYQGNILVEDQRGENRPIGQACDIGAYESKFTPALPSLTINNVAVTEGDTGTVAATFNVSLSSPVNWLVQVSYETQNGTALAGVDYAAESDDLVFQPGETSKDIVVQVYGDTLVEADKTFSVLLSGETHATLINYAGTGSIHDDDGIPPVYRIFLPLLKR